MNFLELCKRLRQESGYAGTGPSSVVNQTGDALRFVTWIQDADLDIQHLRKDWHFMRAGLNQAVSSGTNSVAAPMDFNRMDKASLVLERADGTNFYPSWLEPHLYRMVEREHSDTGGLPLYLTLENGLLKLFPTPNESVTIKADYFVKPVKMTANADEPRLPEEYHMAIVYYALMMYGAYDEASNAWQHANSLWTQYLNQLNMTQLPELALGGALA